MKTTMTTGNLQSFLRLLDDKGMTPERFTAALSSGVLADVFEAEANLTNREVVRSALGLGPLVLPKPDFKVWRKVRYSGRDAAGFRASFKAKGIEIGTYADQILDKVVFPAVGTEVDIVRTSGAQIHFDKSARREAIYERTLGFGLAKLEPWAALEARDEYTDQPNSKWILAGMEPILDADHCPELFRLARDGDGLLWLLSNNGNADNEWNPNNEWLFGLPGK